MSFVCQGGFICHSGFSPLDKLHYVVMQLSLIVWRIISLPDAQVTSLLHPKALLRAVGGGGHD